MRRLLVKSHFVSLSSPYAASSSSSMYTFIEGVNLPSMVRKLSTSRTMISIAPRSTAIKISAQGSVGTNIRCIHGITSSSSSSIHYSLAQGRNNLLVNNNKFKYQNQSIRCMNRNARRPKKANHGKRPCSHARRHAKRGKLKSRAYLEKIFGMWFVK